MHLYDGSSFGILLATRARSCTFNFSWSGIFYSVQHIAVCLLHLYLRWRIVFRILLGKKVRLGELICLLTSVLISVGMTWSCFSTQNTQEVLLYIPCFAVLILRCVQLHTPSLKSKPLSPRSGEEVVPSPWLVEVVIRNLSRLKCYQYSIGAREQQGKATSFPRHFIKKSVEESRTKRNTSCPYLSI